MPEPDPWPSVAVIIPNHTRTNELMQAVRSVDAQRYQGEVTVYLVYEPRDEMIGILDALGGSVVPIPHRADPLASSIAARRNIALRASKEDLVAFLDDDDLWHPDKLRDQVTAMTTFRAVASGTAWVNFSLTGRPVWEEATAVPAGRLQPYDVMRSGRWMTSSTVVDGPTARQLMLDERPEWAGLDDYDFKLRLSKEGRIVLVQRVLTAIRVDPAGGSRSRPTLHFARALDVFAAWIKRDGWSSPAWRAFLVRWAVTAVFPPRTNDLEALETLKESLNGNLAGPLDRVVRWSIEAAWRSSVVVPSLRRMLPQKMID